jgi:hypothetical protein
LPVHIAEDPLTAIALGTGRYLSDINLLCGRGLFVFVLD